MSIAQELKRSSNKSIALAERTFSKFECLVGGREKLYETLQMAPPDRPYAVVLGKFLADDGIQAAPLHEIAIRHRLPISVLVMAYRDAKAILLHLETIEKLAKKMPLISEQIAEESLSRHVKCEKCEGTGRSFVIEGGEFLLDEYGAKATVVCFDCRGKGVVFKESDIQNRRLAVQVTGMIEQKPLVQQTFNQQHNTLNANFIPGDSSFEGLMRAADKVLHAKNVQPKEHQPSSSGDRESSSN